MSSVQTTTFFPGAFVENLFDYQAVELPQNEKERIFSIIEKKLKGMSSSNRTEVYRAVNAFKTLESSLDEKTRKVFLQFFKATLNSGSKELSDYLIERNIPLTEMANIELLDAVERQKVSPKKNKFRTIV